jgi:hypothetical protein
LVVVVVVVAVLVLRHTGSSGRVGATGGPSTTTTTSKSTSPSTTTRTTTPLHPPAQVKVQVLNGLLVGSLAGNLSTRLKAFGYVTLSPQNTTVSTATTVIYVAQHGYYREATRLAGRLHVPIRYITRTIPPTAPIPAEVTAQAPDLIVVIGTSLQTEASTV